MNLRGRLDGGLQETRRLLGVVDKLASLAEVQSWDSAATELADRLTAASAALAREAQECEKLLDAERADLQSLPFFKRMIASRSRLRLIGKAHKELTEYESRLLAAADELQAFIEKTPDNARQAKDIIAELKSAKKELQAQRKEVALLKREVNQRARERNAAINNQWFANSKTKQVQRIGARLEKSAALNPLEDEMGRIDRNILEIDRSIIWIEKILRGREDDVSVQYSVNWLPPGPDELQASHLLTARPGSATITGEPDSAGQSRDTVFAFLGLLLCFPIGLAVMWLGNVRWSRQVKWTITAAFGIFTLFVITAGGKPEFEIKALPQETANARVKIEGSGPPGGRVSLGRNIVVIPASGDWAIEAPLVRGKNMIEVKYEPPIDSTDRPQVKTLNITRQ